MTTPIILTDLDDTLFQTQRKVPENAGDLTVMSTLHDGSDSGYATQKQTAFLAWLRQTGSVIPVTARGSEVLARVNLDYAQAIAANGGVILKDNGASIDEAWHQGLKTKAKDVPVTEMTQLVEPLLDERVRSWPVIERDLELYYCVKSNTDDTARLDEIRMIVTPLLGDGWRVHQNGNNLAFLPPWLNKRHAVRYLIEHLREDDAHAPAIGVGDSHSDTGFMDLCDYAMTPTNSQIWKAFKENNEWCR